MLSTGFSLLQVSVIGPSTWAFAVYQLVFQAEVIFHHSNVRLPIGVERLLNKVLVTPRMHGIHHSQVQRENNSNFGTVFPWWERNARRQHSARRSRRWRSGVHVGRGQQLLECPAHALPRTARLLAPA